MDPLEIVGLRLGPGPWLAVDTPSLEGFWKALDYVDPPAGVPLLYLVSLLPALTAEMSLPLPTPRATINYGLNMLTGGEPVSIGDRLQAITTVSRAGWLGPPDDSPLQIVRQAEIMNQKSQPVLWAETVSRLVF